MEAELAPNVPELLDRLAEFYSRDRDLIPALEAPRSSFYRWKFNGHRPNTRARAKIYQLAIHHGLITAAPPTLRPRSQSDRRPKLEPKLWAGPRHSLASALQNDPQRSYVYLHQQEQLFCVLKSRRSPVSPHWQMASRRLGDARLEQTGSGARGGSPTGDVQ
jgi:hypothetical protein